MRARHLTLYYAIAAINILSTMLPVWPMRYELLANNIAPALILAAQNIALFAGVTMLLLAYPAAEGHRRSAHLLMVCAGVAIGAHLLKGLDIEESLLNVVLLGVVWSQRRRLHSIPLRYTVVDLTRLGVVLVLLTWAYSLLGRIVLRSMRLLVKDGNGFFPTLDRLIHVMTAKLQLQHTWFHESQLVLPLFLLLVFLVISWTSLARAGEAHPGGDLYARFGRDSQNSLAYLARRTDLLTFLDPAGRGAITYRRVGRVALQIGAILAAPADRAAVYGAFHAYCTEQRLLPAAAALAQEERAIVARYGMRSLSIGTEAMVDLAQFAVDRLAKKVRWAQRSLAKRGYQVVLWSAADVAPPLRAALDRIDAEWLRTRGGKSHGCCMTLGRFPTHADADCVIAIASDATQTPVAYLTLLPGGAGYYSLDLTRRVADAPNAIMEFLVVDVLAQLQARGASYVSLNFSTFSSVGQVRGGGHVLTFFGRFVQLRSLEAFNAKFRPDWTPRYTVFPSWHAFPDVVYAMLVVEGIDRMVLNAGARALRRLLHPAPALRFETRIQPEGGV